VKALLHYGASTGYLAALEARRPDWLDVAVVAEADDESFYRELPDTDVILHALRPISAADMDLAPQIKLIQKIGIGVNTIDVEAATQRGIAVVNMPGSNAIAVAETALMLMLAASRRLTHIDRATRAGQGWEIPPEDYDHVSEIAGKTVGLVGYGAIPQHLAPILTAMGARVLYTAQSLKSDAVADWRALDDLIEEADILSLHIPQTEETTGIISHERMARMKKGVVFINTARGGLVDEAALARALQTGQIGAAGLDVYAGEPVDPANPLLAMDNVICMPHISWLTPQTLERSLDIAVENCRRIRDGVELLHHVNG
jgi:phosphoglycerate dehydrogenase-like enzyme